ncbi:phenylalanine--tRNA ligase subunit alpha [Mycoplasmopsis felis]|uniref:phenylalanine--tRNA ligase subunit alpha n=1 Tax=Mycoplasmopsis felis TaxID=33923 RepID=UPI002AF6A4CD|nr:phenylalanine--tRNA ligase subunit alpha [Mycoplasmopsis felis]WQQ02388.1 phenylalanine--tRNA ligase subunit alpha [Mycoplasmopsis felis]WQQ05706.1 phenylalanine--tRNA ligase subunit alpha [Mycoplasmopsis felis]WQQ07293.1 phenylalanine--tRNA ligase subunit alpha [Mycoplasmopsis felis]WQQ08336.1 phenylalanine--tRNA ligase subunit alpha [Mycoplasmopsis felis]WRX06394.1 phenylalanine--tRNA ligase subunit alpha [Mycoplasmopsis felis]
MFKLEDINTLEDLKQAKAQVYGNKGEIFELQNQLKTSPIELKKELGQKINLLKKQYEDFFEQADLRIKEIQINNKINSEFIDISEPVNKQGSIHPITIVEERLKEWFIQHGYYQRQEGEIVSDLYNFEQLNIPKDHPARTMHDSLYIDKNTLLRTHNTGITAKILQENPNKEIAVFALGKVYRNDEDDATHSHQFTQLDFVSVGKVSFPNLIWTLKSLLSYVLEEEVEIRLRPSYFPFTEPSVEVDVFYKNKWIEILGAGMLHPNVLKLAGYTNDYNGFAAGLGIERITMIKYGFTDIRDLYKNDLRILEQFNNER